MGVSMKFTDLDQYLFGQGTNYEVYKKLGAHPTTYRRKKGVYFAVWAPNAQSVSVIGEFNDWEEEASCNEGGLTYKWTGSDVSDDEAATASITVTYNSNSEISYNTYTCEVTDKYGNSEEISFTVGSYNPSDMSDTSKVYVISYNEEVKCILEDMLSKRSDLKGKIAFINLRTGGTDPNYLEGVDLVMEQNPDATFIVAGDGNASMLEGINDRNKYLTVDELGLTSAYSAAYPYTRKAGTFDGKLTAMTWQANPGIFMYDPDIAQWSGLYHIRWRQCQTDCYGRRRCQRSV